MFPEVLHKYDFKPLPKSRRDNSVRTKLEKYTALYGNDYVNSIVLTQEDAIKLLSELGIHESTVFYNYYLHSIYEPENKGELLFGLKEVYDAAKKPFFDNYPLIGKRYLQISSIEGEHSYFYDTETDCVYSLDWSDMSDFFDKGDLKSPQFISFYDLLEWYYT